MLNLLAQTTQPLAGTDFTSFLRTNTGIFFITAILLHLLRPLTAKVPAVPNWGWAAPIAVGLTWVSVHFGFMSGNFNSLAYAIVIQVAGGALSQMDSGSNIWEFIVNFLTQTPASSQASAQAVKLSKIADKPDNPA